MAKIRRSLLVLALIAFASVFALVYVKPTDVPSLAAYAFTSRQQQKTVLYWNSFFGKADFYLGEGYIASECPRYNDCFFTHSRFLKSVDAFDVLLFHGINEELDYDDLPRARRAEQKYVFLALESPANRGIAAEFDGYFNATVTYQADSDVVDTYADVISRTTGAPLVSSSNYTYPINEEADRYDASRAARMTESKKKLAVWYRSNCETQSGRENYVAELENHMELDSFGACSSTPGCPKDRDCFKSEVEPDYFFYLSFENSLCDDYVTEKFFNALKHYVVPVVYGGAAYARFAPPNSFINALDFDTPRDLAKYLTSLSRNASEYSKFFDWKERYRVLNSRQRVICDLCELAHREQKKTYAISKWYGKGRCPLQRRLSRQRARGGPAYATKKTLLVQ